jgi:hypothetical protein
MYILKDFSENRSMFEISISYKGDWVSYWKPMA